MKTISAVILGAAALIAFAMPAQALNTRSWISGKGADNAGCGPIATPCRTLQFAHDQTAAGGEIDVLDPAGYGAVVINKSISIVNDGVGVAGVLAGAGANAITINAGASDRVLLRGLAIEGASTGANGVVHNSGGYLTIENCSVRDFRAAAPNGNGIWLKPTGYLRMFISNTTIANNGNIGLYARVVGASNGIDVTADRIAVTYNGYGTVVSPSGTDAISAAHVMNSVFAFNSQMGLQITSDDGTDGIGRGYIDMVHASNNGGNDIRSTGRVYTVISRTTGSNVYGSFVSYGNNQIDFLYGSNVSSKALH